jgi:hypothetical protein
MSLDDITWLEQSASGLILKISRQKAVRGLNVIDEFKRIKVQDLEDASLINT